MLDSSVSRSATTSASLTPDVGASASKSDPAAQARSEAGAVSVQRALSGSDFVNKDGSTERDVCGVRIIAPVGVQPNTVDTCAGLVQGEIGNNEYAQNALRKKKTALIIVPANVHMTDLPQFKQLGGGSTPDGRGWENVRGSGGMQIPDGTFALAVPEENLVTMKSIFSGYGPGYSVGRHEFAHTLEDAAMTKDQVARIQKMFAARQVLQVAVGGAFLDIFTDHYASTNEHEYWAQCTDCFFGTNEGEGANGREWLEAHDPDMYAFCVEMYEHHHDKKGNDTGPGAPATPPASIST
jgi:hypothetical protein